MNRVLDIITEYLVIQIGLITLHIRNIPVRR